jgi:hypothetical protein
VRWVGAGNEGACGDDGLRCYVVVVDGDLLSSAGVRRVVATKKPPNICAIITYSNIYVSAERVATLPRQDHHANRQTRPRRQGHRRSRDEYEGKISSWTHSYIQTPHPSKGHAPFMVQSNPHGLKLTKNEPPKPKLPFTHAHAPILAGPYISPYKQLKATRNKKGKRREQTI